MVEVISSAGEDEQPSMKQRLATATRRNAARNGLTQPRMKARSRNGDVTLRKNEELHLRAKRDG